MALTRRQELAYEDTCNLWAPEALTYSGSEPQDKGYTLASSAVACLLLGRTEVAQPEAFGRFGKDNIFTLDVVRFEASVTIDDGYILKITTTGALANTFWMVMGEAQVRISRARRKPNFKSVYVKRLPAAPNGVS